MDGIIDGISDWWEEVVENVVSNMKDGLIEGIGNNLSGIFTNLDDSVGEVGGIVSLSPESWNSTIFDFVKGISEDVVIPIAGVIITYVLIYELITMVMDKNNFHDFDSSLFFRYIFKACIAVVLLSHTFEIVEAIFELGGDIASSASSYITGSTSVGDMDTTLLEIIEDNKDDLGLMQILMYWIETLLISFLIKAMSIYIIILMFMRFLEIYMYMSVAPIPFATLTNKEWGSIGTNYIKGLLALAFQAFLIMVLVGIYATLVDTLTSATIDNFEELLGAILTYTVLLAIMLSKTSSISKSILNTH